MKKLIFALLACVALQAGAYTHEEAAQESTVFDRYAAIDDQVVVFRRYELPEFKFKMGTGISSYSYKGDVAVVSFTIGDKVEYYLEIEWRTNVNYPKIKRYISYNDLVALRKAVETFDADFKTARRNANYMKSSYTTPDFHGVGYEISTNEKKGEIIETVNWIFKPESRSDSYTMYGSESAPLKDLFTQAIDKIDELKK